MSLDKRNGHFKPISRLERSYMVGGIAHFGYTCVYACVPVCVCQFEI